MTRYACLLLATVAIFATPAWAVEEGAVKTPASAAVEVPAGMSDLDQRLELSREMHKIRPTGLQVDMAVKQVARSIPEADRAAFADKMKAAIDQKKLEQKSIDAMAEVFTTAELQKMVEYYNTPEAKSAAEKMPLYQGMIQPEIIKMLDKAMMEVRTGKAVEEQPPAPAKEKAPEKKAEKAERSAEPIGPVE